MDTKKTPYFSQEEIGLREISHVLWHGRRSIVLITALFAICAATSAWLTPKKYQASIVISPVTETSAGQLGGVSSLASQFGGLASLAGISVTGDSRKAESIAVLQSEALTGTYIRENDLLPILYQDIWDAREKKWKEANPEKIPTLWTANRYFKKNVRRVVVDNKTGLVTLTITWTDPKLAANWANDLVKMTNYYLRNRAIELSERNISYLSSEVAKTDIVEARQAIYSVLQTELNKAMLARGSDEYAFKVIDPAIVPEEQSSPKLILWVGSASVAGFLLSVLTLLARNSVRT